MLTTITVLDSTYEWESCTLLDFLREGNYPEGWDDFFHSSEVQTELENISKSLSEVKSVIYPPINKVFRAFYMCRPEDVRVSILALDPYTNGNAVGLCFSVPKGVTINPSLRNIYTELKNSGYTPKEDGCLIHWAKQGCFLINTALTVKQGDSESHIKIWAKFSRLLMEYISNKNPDIAWILLGKNAQNYEKYITGKVFKTSHPSPLSARRGFLGSGIFRSVNDFLGKEKQICW